MEHRHGRKLKTQGSPVRRSPVEDQVVCLGWIGRNEETKRRVDVKSTIVEELGSCKENGIKAILHGRYGGILMEEK